MWRLLLVMVIAGLAAGACGESEVDVEEFYRRIRALGDGTFTVTYDWVYESPNLGAFAETRTWYQDAKSERIDYPRDGELNVFISTREHSYNCSTLPNRNSGLPGCYLKLGSSVPFYSPMDDHLNAFNSPHFFEVTRIDDRTIASEKTHCFSTDVKSSSKGWDGTLCLSEDCLLLHAEAFPNRPTWTATNVTREVPEGIFEPPMEVTGEDPACSTIDC